MQKSDHHSSNYQSQIMITANIRNSQKFLKTKFSIAICVTFPYNYLKDLKHVKVYFCQLEMQHFKKPQEGLFV